MSNILIFGNSGSGKSTLAKNLCENRGLAHLDLDTLAWTPTVPPERKTLDESWREIENFINSHECWVIEGCYTDLLELVKESSSEIIFMNLPVDACISNAKNRPWEPHKYESKEAQDDNLEMLVGWIRQYGERNDTFSEAAHQKFYDQYSGKKSMVTRNETRITSS
ncbi:AAA family ATPase [Sinobacterium caligoides]|uniref:AAA family ATPase n=1 Tax=Sinobacterium caligoides TaxID=933926 RepID=UPI000F4C108A|nr:AAA family ATPase [Sinobacterium caligoides]